MVEEEANVLDRCMCNHTDVVQSHWRIQRAILSCQASNAAIPAVTNYDLAHGRRKQGMERTSACRSVLGRLTGAKRAGIASKGHCWPWDSKMQSKIKNATTIMQQKKMYKNTSVQGESCKDVVLALFHLPLVRATNNKGCCVRCGFPRACSFHALQSFFQGWGKFGCFRKTRFRRLIVLYSST